MTPFSTESMKRVALFHGAGYVGGELIRLVLHHPSLMLDAVTSDSHAGMPVFAAHPPLAGQTDLGFVAADEVDVAGLDLVISAAPHGVGRGTVERLRACGYAGPVVDVSSDYRHVHDAGGGDGYIPPEPETVAYGLPEVTAPYPSDTTLVANPGCFATAIALALWPLSRHLPALTAHVTALTGASGSGARPSPTTHYPARDGNVRAYKVLAHQHVAEVLQVLGTGVDLAFTPASGPWTRGIWGTAHVDCGPLDTQALAGWYDTAYGDAPFVRLQPGRLPELRHTVMTPFCDVGWVIDGRHLVVGFALDNLMKGAASQAIQNANLLLGLPQHLGLLPGSVPTYHHHHTLTA